MKMSSAEPEKLSLAFRLAFGMGNMINVLGIVGMWFPYGPSYLSRVLKLEHTGTIILVAQVVGGVFAPVIGILCDLCPCRFYGRRKTWHLLGMLAFTLSFFFLWHDCFGCAPKYRTMYYSLITIPFQFGYSAMQIAQLALVPELAPNKHIKVELNQIRFIFQVGGTLIALGVLWVLLAELPPSNCSPVMNGTLTSVSCHTGDVSQLDEGDQRAFWVMAIICLGVGFLMSIPFHIVFREKNAVLKKLKWFRWLLKPNFYLVIVTYVCVRIIIIFTQQNFPFYFLDTLSMNKTSVSVGPLVLYAAMFFATLTVKRINKLVGENMMYFIGVVFVWGALMWFWVQPAYPEHISDNFFWKRDIVYVAVILLGIGGATLMVISLSMISILIGDFSGSSAFVYGWVLLGDRVFNGVLNKIVLTLQASLSQRSFSPSYEGERAVIQPLPLTSYSASSHMPLPEPRVSTTGPVTPASRLFSRHVVVFTPLAATAVGLLAVCLMALWEYYERRKMQEFIVSNSVRIDYSVADRGSQYSLDFKNWHLPDTCCSCCRHRTSYKPMLEESERQALLESCREQLRSSVKRDPVDYRELDCSLAI